MANVLIADFWDVSTPGLGPLYTYGWQPGAYDLSAQMTATRDTLYAVSPIVTAQHTMTLLTAAVQCFLFTDSNLAHIGAYEADANGLPNTLVYDSGQVQTRAGSTHVVSPNVYLKPRTLYWLTTLCCSDWSVFGRGAQVPGFFSVGSGKDVCGIVTASRGYGALPSTFPTATMSAGVTGPEVVVRIV